MYSESASKERQIKKNYIYLTGGLGNQLFQLTALAALSEKRQLVVDAINGAPRGEQIGSPESNRFNLFSTSPVIFDNEFSRLTKRAIGYSLRSNINPTELELSLKVPNVARFLTSVLLSISCRELLSVKVCQGIGFDADIKQSFFNTYFVGYFQSYKWSNSLREAQELNVELIKPSDEVDYFRRLAQAENPLVVHVRLGDYLSEGGFGTLGESYYARAITNAINSGNFGKIWLFSDDPKGALERLPSNLELEIRNMPDFGDSPASTLEVMRLGKGYVIANSTFSWWGAALSYELNPIVIYPYPWFQSMDSPLELVPPHWLPVSTA